MGVVYKITNTLDGKCYIGITKNTFRIRYNHKDDWWNAPNVNRHLKSAVNKYGSGNFTVDIILECCETELEEKEKYFIEMYDSFNVGYNLTTGGNYKYKLSEESKLKVSVSQKKRLENVDVWNKGKKLSKEHCENLSTAHIGQKAWNKGIKTGPMKQEHINNSAEGHKKRVAKVDLDGTLLKEYNGLIETKKDGYDPSCVSGVCKGNLKTHKGFNWIYI